LAFTQTPSGGPKDLLWGVSRFPLMFREEANRELYKLVSSKEIHGIVLSFQGDKSLGPDSWTVEIFSHFYDLFKFDLVNLVEGSRNMGYVHPHLKSTYITLIPKKKTLYTFSDFRPISLCNLVYKIISKTISNRLKPILSKFISPQQYGFLKHQ